MNIIFHPFKDLGVFSPSPPLFNWPIIHLHFIVYPFWGIAGKSDHVRHPCNTTIIGKFQTLPGINYCPFHHLFLKRRVFFDLFSTDSKNMKRLPSYWPLQLVKVIGSVIPPLDFNLFELEGSLHIKIERLFCSAH